MWEHIQSHKSKLKTEQFISVLITLTLQVIWKSLMQHVQIKTIEMKWPNFDIENM